MNTKDENKEVMESTSPWLLDSEFGELLSEDIVFISQLSEHIYYPKGTFILQQDDRVNKLLYINKGLVRCSLLNSDGKEKLLPYTNRFLALECFFHKFPIAYNAKAVEDVEIFAISNEHINKILTRVSITQVLLKSLSMRCRILGWQINDLSFNNTVEKVCRLIYCFILDNEDKVNLHKKNNNKVKLTHQELAAMAGVHRITITNTITQLKNEGLIRVDEEGIIDVLDWKRIRQLGFGECM